jgi:hypothetical protein
MDTMSDQSSAVFELGVFQEEHKHIIENKPFPPFKGYQRLKSFIASVFREIQSYEGLEH